MDINESESLPIPSPTTPPPLSPPPPSPPPPPSSSSPSPSPPPSPPPSPSPSSSSMSSSDGRSMDLCTSSDAHARYCDMCHRVESGFGDKFKKAIIEGRSIAYREWQKLHQKGQTVYDLDEIRNSIVGCLNLGNYGRFHLFLSTMSTSSVHKELFRRALGFSTPIMDGFSDSLEYHFGIGRCDFEERDVDCFVEDFDICKLIEIECRERGLVETVRDGTCTHQQFVFSVPENFQRRPPPHVDIGGNADTGSDVSSEVLELEPMSTTDEENNEDDY